MIKQFIESSDLEALHHDFLANLRVIIEILEEFAIQVSLFNIFLAILIEFPE